MLKKQTIFDRVVRHLIKQGVRAVTETGVCKYLTADGKMCAAGCLIPKKLYNSNIEGFSIDATGMPSNLVTRLFKENITQHLAFVRALQNVHDGSGDDLLTKGNLVKLLEIARANDLKEDVLKEFEQKLG